MTTASVTSSDVRVRNAVVRQLDWDPEVDAGAIGVSASGGVITLTGLVDTYAGKLAAERVAKRVRGVRAIVNDLTVRLRVERTDADIAHDALRALELIPALADQVQVAVHHGHLTLTGRVEWLYQRRQAESILRHLRGVHGIDDHITVSGKTGQRDVQRRIVRALHRNADIDARHITVGVTDSTVVLQGTVSSLLQRDAVERAAGSAPGITAVDNRILVVPPEPFEPEPPEEIC